MSIIKDLPLTLAYLFASCLSLLMLSSVSPDRFLQQAVILVIGFVLYLYLSSQEAAVYRSFAPVGYLLSITLLLITFVFRTVTRGTTSWLDVAGFRFQPSELTKPLLIISFAYLQSHLPPTKLKNIILNTTSFVIPFILIILQPDLGTAMVLGAIWVVQIFVSNLPWRYLIGTILIATLTLPYLLGLLHSYQLSRLTSFIDPFADPLGSGYNVIQSMIAVGSGGIMGQGLGHGTQSHLRFLPERHTDFAFASIAEELGLFGTLMIIAIISTIVFRLLRSATSATTSYNRAILFGAVAYFAFQALVNIGMNIGIAPITGITLPLISYGGSSVIASSIILGITTSIIVEQNSPPLLEIR